MLHNIYPHLFLLCSINYKYKLCFVSLQRGGREAMPRYVFISLKIVRSETQNIVCKAFITSVVFRQFSKPIASSRSSRAARLLSFNASLQNLARS